MNTLKNWLRTLSPKTPAMKAKNSVRHSRWQLTALEDRITPTLAVTNAWDAGPGSLRQAFLDLNAGLDASSTQPWTIDFQVAPYGVINLLSPLPDLVHRATINGNYTTVSGDDTYRIKDFTNINLNSPSYTNFGYEVEVYNLGFIDGNADQNGGAVRAAKQRLRFRNCFFQDNTAATDGGAISIQHSFGPQGVNGGLELENCTFYNNITLDGNGGAIDTVQQVFKLQQCTLVGNIAYGATSTGGSINFHAPFFNSSQPIVIINNSTITQNQALGDGSDVNYASNLKLDMKSTIISGLGGGFGPDPLRMPVRPQGWNTITNCALDSTNNIGYSTITASNNLIGQGTLFGLHNIGNNGGFNGTRLPKHNSTLINAGIAGFGNNKDQRGTGFPRTQLGAIDIGAVESAVFYQKVASTIDGEIGSLRDLVLQANAEPGLSYIDFDTAVFTTDTMLTLTLGEILIADDTIIRGPEGVAITINANNSSRIFRVEKAGVDLNVILDRITLKDGNAGMGAGGGIYNVGENLELNNVKIISSDAVSGGAIRSENGTLLVRNSEFRSNNASLDGGGVSVENGAAYFIESQFTDNTALRYGGGQHIKKAVLTVRKAGDTSNHAETGGGAYFEDSTVFVQDSTFSGNSASLDGGGVSISGGTASLLDTKFADNTALRYGGGQHIKKLSGQLRSINTIGNTAGTGGGAYFDNSTVTVTTSAFSQNRSSGEGGGIALNRTTAGFEACDIRNNTSALGGGGLVNFAGSNAVVLVDGTVSGNSAGGAGGGIMNYGQMSANRLKWQANTARASGGAIVIGPDGVGTCFECSITDNIADSDSTGDGNGGGVANDGVTTIRNSTLARNTVRGAVGSLNGNGGGFCSSTPITIINSTIVSNTVPNNGGGGDQALILPNPSKFEGNTITDNRSDSNGDGQGSGGGLYGFGNILINNIVHGNLHGDPLTSSPDNVFGSVHATSSNNLLGEGASSGGLVNGVNGNQVGVLDVWLGVLQANGGFTETRLPLAQSPAVDAGAASAEMFDQRGLTRSVGRTDIGAVEVQPPIVTIVVNGGAVQRSRVSIVVLNFSRPVNAATLAAAGGLSLVRSSDGTSVNTGSGLTIAPVTGFVGSISLSFATAPTAGTEFGSLKDGRWQVGIPSLNYTSPLLGTGLFRLFGDVNGDGTVDGGSDFSTFSFVSGAGNPFDFNNDGTIDGPTDYSEFGTRFGHTVA